jgi:hypothetical protein
MDLVLDRGHRICVYDDVFDSKFLNYLYAFSIASNFSIGMADSRDIEKRRYPSIYSPFSEDDLTRLGLVDALQKSKVSEELNGYIIKQCILNLSTASDVNFIHTHRQEKILLVYVNLEWGEGYHGETLFFDNTKKDIIFASNYTPNRVIAFSGACNHTIRPQSHLAPYYRFTLSLFLDKE